MTAAFQNPPGASDDVSAKDGAGKIRLRVSYGGAIIPDQDRAGCYRYSSGHTYLETVPSTITYAEFIFRLSEKTSCGVSVKYLLPGEELDPDSLITVSDDADLQEMFEEYQRGLAVPGTPIRTFRLRVLLFSVVEVPYSVGEPFTPEEIQDGHDFFARSSMGMGPSGGSSRALPSIRLGQSALSSALSSSCTTPRVVSSGAAPVPLIPAGAPLTSPMPEPPDEDLATWQAGFIAGQEAAAFEARLPSGSLDQDISDVLSPVKSRQSETPKSSRSFGRASAYNLAAHANGGFAQFWHQPEEDSGYPDYDTVQPTQLGGSATRSTGKEGDSLLGLLPSNISAFGGNNHLAGESSGTGPLAPAVPPVADMVTSGVCLPSHISAFGDMVGDLQQEGAEGSPMDDHQPGVGQFQDAVDRLHLPKLHPTRPHPAGPHTPPIPSSAGRGAEGADGRLGRPLSATSPTALLSSRVHRMSKSEVEFGPRVGEGAFGDVYLAKSPIFGQVAVKWLKTDKAAQLGLPQVTQSFGAEAEVLASVNHPNVLRFYGVITQSDEDPSVIGIMTEYIKGGSLADLIRQQVQRGKYLSLRDRAQIALGAVKGLAYLHKMRIVHFDLKPDNLLLDYTADGLTVKVADFGLHKHKHEHRSYVSGISDLRGTLPYMAPELVNDPTHVSEKADVWSLGMVLLEMLELKVPFSDLKPQEIVRALMNGSPLPQVPAWCEPEWKQVIEACWEAAPDARCALPDLARHLENILAGFN